MSKICGVYYYDCRPVPAEDEAFVRTALQGRGYSDSRVQSSEGALFGCAAGCDFAGVDGVWESHDRSLWTWDGRLDNRSDLLRQTGLAPDSCGSAILAALYRRKGVEGFFDAIGDWSLAMYDPGRRAIVLASDYAGIRPLYYRLGQHALYWSSSLSDLVRWTGESQLDDAYAAAFLTRAAPPGRSPYAGVASVPPGHAVSVSASRIESRAFWAVTGIGELHHAEEQDYEEQLLELFREAVRARFSAASPNCAELSGGLDSSSVVCMADRLGKEAGRDFRGLYTFSYTHERCPDEEYFREVENACGLTGIHLQIHDYPPVSAQAGSAAPAWWTPRFQEISRRMADLGAGVFLTGQFGDLIMGNTNDDTDQVADCFAHFRLLRGASEAYRWAKSLQVPIYPILWRSMRTAWTRWIPDPDPRTGPGALRLSADDSLTPRLKDRLGHPQADPAEWKDWRNVPPGRRRRFLAVSQTLLSRALQAPEPLQHVTFAHPFAHRPLVEFMLAVPPALVCAPGQPRRLMRRAFSGLLPARVLNRKSKAAYTQAYVGALIPLAKAMFTQPDAIQIVAHGFADPNSLLPRLERFTQGVECNESQLRHLILFEFWLRNRAAAPRQAAA